MPMGPGPIGFLAFAGVKWAGYSLAAKGLNYAYENQSNGPVKVGLVRTGIGVATGLLYTGVWFLVGEDRLLAMFVVPEGLWIC